MTAATNADRRPAELAPAAALVLAVVLTLVPHAVGSALLRGEQARAVSSPHTEAAR